MGKSTGKMLPILHDERRRKKNCRRSIERDVPFKYSREPREPPFTSACCMYRDARYRAPSSLIFPYIERTAIYRRFMHAGVERLLEKIAIFWIYRELSYVTISYGRDDCAKKDSFDVFRCA